MEGEKEILKEWIVEYLKSKDAVTKQITAIKRDSENADVVIEGALKNKYVIVQPEFNDLSKLDFFKEKHVVIVTKNTRENVEFLITHWDVLAKNPHLSIYFVNPESSLDKRWIIFPATHNRITEKKALRKGIESLYATVEPWKG